MKKAIQGCFLVLVCISLGLSGCSGTRGDDSSVSEDVSVQPIFPFSESIIVSDPEGRGADSYLTTSDSGKVFMSWTEDNPVEGRNLFIATVASGGQQVSEIRQVNHGPVAGHGGENLAKFAVTADEDVWAIFQPVSHIHHRSTVAASHAESGGPFSPEVRLNDDRSAAEESKANFTAIGTSPDGRIFALWLDGRSDDEAKKVFVAVSEDGGRTFSKNYPVSDAVCPCCRPAIEFLDGGKTVVIAYREYAIPSGYIEPDNVRNHVMIRSTDGGKTFSDPVLISDDGWVAYGCPHAGISMSSDSQNRIHVAWWTGGRTPDEAGIYYSYSEDSGKSFAPRQLISKAPDDTVLHTRVIVDKNDTVYATWEDLKEKGSLIFLAHRSAGKEDWSQIYQVSDGTWNASYPMLAVDDENLYVAFTERKGEEAHVRLQTSPLVGN
jgi:hypothetical protein